MFEKSQPKKIRADIAKIIRYKLDEVQSVLGAFIPIHFFTLMEYQQNGLPTSEDDMINSFLNNLDA